MLTSNCVCADLRFERVKFFDIFIKNTSKKG